MPGHLRDRLPVPRQALTHIVILEGMEKVASQLPVVSWSARGIANATYVVWRILWEMGGEAVSGSLRHPPETPRGQDTALPTPVTFPVSPSIRVTAAPRCRGKGTAHTPTLQPHLLLEVHLCLLTLQRGEKGEEPYWACSHGPVPPTPSLISTEKALL